MSETRTEYRVVGENFREEFYESGPFPTLPQAKASLQGWRIEGAHSGRIQSRTQTPWQDIDESEES